jgi:hypothetical protein
MVLLESKSEISFKSGWSLENLLGYIRLVRSTHSVVVAFIMEADATR